MNENNNQINNPFDDLGFPKNENEEINNNYENKKGLISLIISIINIIIAPGVVEFFGAFLILLMIFGGSTGDFSNANMYFFVTLILIYIFFSLFFVLVSYVKFFKRSKTKKRKYTLIIVGLIILLILYKYIAPISRVIINLIKKV